MQFYKSKCHFVGAPIGGGDGRGQFCLHFYSATSLGPLLGDFGRSWNHPWPNLASILVDPLSGELN